MTVREAELLARKIAVERARKKEKIFDPEVEEIEGKLTESLGTRVHIEKGDKGGKITIDFFSNDDLREILSLVESQKKKKADELLNRHIAEIEKDLPPKPEVAIDDRSIEEKKADDENDALYSVKNFSI